jgi:hypothetical protein
MKSGKKGESCKIFRKNSQGRKATKDRKTLTKTQDFATLRETTHSVETFRCEFPSRASEFTQWRQKKEKCAGFFAWEGRDGMPLIREGRELSHELFIRDF